MGFGFFNVCGPNIFPSKFIYGELTTLDVQLPDDRIYLMSIDQSSKETGIYLTDLDVSFHFIGTVERRLQDKYRYYEEIRLFLKRLLRGKTLGLFVREDLPPVNRGRALPVLGELVGILNSWRSSGDIPEFTNLPDDKWEKIMPSTWKSKIIDKSKGKGRFNKKREIASDLVDKFPELVDYFNSVKPSSDYDGFDACGILHGYIATHYSDTGAKIAGTKDFQGDIMVYCRSVSKEELSDRESLLEWFFPQEYDYGHKWLEMNTEASYYDNIRRAASKHPFVLTIVNDLLTSIALRWQHGIGMDSNPLLLYIVRKNIMKKSQLDKLEEVFHYEKVTW